MEDNIFRKITEKMDYTTYKRVINILFGTDLAAIASFTAMGAYTFINPDQMVFYANNMAYLLGIAGVLGGTVDCFEYFSGEEYTRDLLEIKLLYNEFLKNYNKLNKTFELESPLEIYLLFYDLLYKGYFSKDKKFNYNKENLLDIHNMYGTMIFTGNAVCRHIGCMLSDIMTNYDISSNIMIVYHMQPILCYEAINEEKYTKEELINWIKNNIENKDDWDRCINWLLKTIQENGNILLYWGVNDTINSFERKYGNHLITYAVQDGKKYFLDATIGCIYRQDEYEKLTCRHIQCFIRKNKSYITNVYYKDREKKKVIDRELKNVTTSEEILAKYRIRKICSSNEDIFMQFYDENKAIYDEVTDRLLNIKKRKLFK